MELSQPQHASIKQAFRTYKTQIYNLRYPIISITALVVLIMLALYIAGTIARVPLGIFTRDPAAIANLPFYTGIVSHITLACWSATGAICFLGVFIMSGLRYDRKTRSLLLYTAVVNFFLLVDDALQLHETVLPEVFGISEYVVYTAYLLMFAGFPIFYWRQIMASEHLLLLLAVGALGLSIGIDFIFDYTERMTFLEDAFKLLGAVFWLAHFTRYTRSAIRQQPA